MMSRASNMARSFGVPVLLALLAGTAAQAQSSDAVSDLAHEISPAARQRLDEMITAHQTTSGHHILVTTVPTGAAVGLGDIAAGALNALGADADSSVVLVHDHASGETRIVAGSQLGGRLPADMLYAIQTTVMAPRLNQGDAGGAFVDAVTKIIALDVAPPPQPASANAEPKRSEASDTIRIAMIGAPILLLLYIAFATWVRIGQRRAGLIPAKRDTGDEKISRTEKKRARKAARLRQAKHGHDHGHKRVQKPGPDILPKPKHATPDHPPRPYKAPAARAASPSSPRHPTVERPAAPGTSAAPLPGFGRRFDR